MLKLAARIAGRGYAVDLVLARKQGALLEDVPSPARVIDLRAPRTLSSIWPLARYLRRERPDALLSGLHANLIALWASKIARVPTRIVISERTTLSRRVEYYRSDDRMRWMPRLVQACYPWADAIVAVSGGVADDLVRKFGIRKERIRVIYNPIVTPELRAKAQYPLNHDWFGAGKPPVVLAVGRLTPAKDYPTLIAAFHRASEKFDARLLILGEGEERCALEALVRRLKLEGRVGMPGFIANPFPYMARAAVFVLSSCWEGLPGVLVEAMCCGAPLIATDCPSGPREILAEGRYGRLVPPEDVVALAKAIVDGLEGKIHRPPMESWQRFEADVIANQYIEVLFGNAPQSLQDKSPQLARSAR